MNDQNNEPAGQAAKTGPDLERLSDDELQAVTQKAAEILEDREKEKRADAIKRIKAIAKEHGLIITVKEPPRKKGRPKKAASV